MMDDEQTLNVVIGGWQHSDFTATTNITATSEPYLFEEMAKMIQQLAGITEKSLPSYTYWLATLAKEQEARTLAQLAASAEELRPKYTHWRCFDVQFPDTWRYWPLGVGAAEASVDMVALARPTYRRRPKRRSSRRLAVQAKRQALGLPPDGKLPPCIVEGKRYRWRYRWTRRESYQIAEQSQRLMRKHRLPLVVVGEL